MKIRTATEQDLEAIVAVHVKAFPGFFLTQLGRGFLTELYRGFLVVDSGILIVALDSEGLVAGFAAGTYRPESFFSVLRRKRGHMFFLKAVPAVFRNPIVVLRKLWGAVFYHGDSIAPLKAGALLSSIGVNPALKGRGIGKVLLQEFERFACSKGATSVYLTTDSVNNTPVVAFYESQDYMKHDAFDQGNGRRMLRLVKSFDK